MTDATPIRPKAHPHAEALAWAATLKAQASLGFLGSGVQRRHDTKDYAERLDDAKEMEAEMDWNREGEDRLLEDVKHE